MMFQPCARVATSNALMPYWTIVSEATQGTTARTAARRGSAIRSRFMYAPRAAPAA